MEKMTVYKFLEKLDIDTEPQNIPHICVFYDTKIDEDSDLKELDLDIGQEDAMNKYGDYILLNWSIVNHLDTTFLGLRVQDMGC